MDIIQLLSVNTNDNSIKYCPTADMFLPAKCEFDNLAKSAANVTLFNYNWEYVTFILYNTALICGIRTYIETYGKTVVVGKRMFYPIIPAHTHQIVLFGIDLEDIRSLLSMMKECQVDNTSKYVVVCESNQTNDCKESDAVKLLWEFKITNVVFINIINYYIVTGYTYFLDVDCTNSPPVKVYHWNYSSNVGNASTKYGMFPLKFRNLHGCPLIVSTFVQKPYMEIQDNVPSGADGDFLNIIVKAINATLKLMTPRKGAGWGYKNSNNTWVGSLGDLDSDFANVSMTSASITTSRYRGFQMSSFYNSVTVVWVTHPLTLEPASMKLLKPLEAKTRIVFLVSLLMTLVLVFLLKQKRFSLFRARINLRTLPDGIVLQCFEMCMGQPVARMPKQMALLYLLLFWIWYCFLIRTFYQVYLIDSLKNDIYLAGFEDIEAAIEKGYPFGGGAALNDFFIEQPEVYDNWINIESNEMYSILEEMAEGKKFVLAMNIATIQIYLKETKKKLFMLPGKIASSHSVLFFKKYSPLADPVSKILTRLFECGWPQKIYKNNTIQIFKTVPPNDDRPIKLEHYTGCYIILVIGWIISLGSFFIELCTKITIHT